MAAEISGRCLCGAVSYKAALPSHDVSVCHCGMCRRWTGGPLMYVDIEGAPSFTGRDEVGLYRSSDTGERGFCKRCGSVLFWKVAGQERYAFTAGSLDQADGLTLTKEIFIEYKPAFYEFANATEKLYGSDAMAVYTGTGDEPK
jgi:hypothetical protein